MLRNYVIAALRNLARNRLYAAINLIGLAVGFAAAILIALFVRDELSFDRFWPDYQRVYLFTMQLHLAEMAPWNYDAVPGNIPALLKQRLPANVQVARYAQETHALRHEAIEDNENITWVDPDLFAILRLPVIAGSLEDGVHRPDGVVLTRSAARKYFGDRNPIAQTMELDREHVLRVTAVVADIPENSHFAGRVFVSGLGAFSALAQFDVAQAQPGAHGFSANIGAYLKLPSGISATDVQAQLAQVTSRFLESAGDLGEIGLILRLVPVAEVHLSAPAGNGLRGNPGLLYAISLTGVLIVAVAGINFVILMTARAGRRAVEIGVRKAAGAGFRDLGLQFVGESLLYCLIAMVLAVALVELLLPAFDAFVHKTLSLGYSPGPRGEPGLYVMLFLLVLGTGVSAGFYPACVLSRFRPANVLKEGRGGGTGHGIGGHRIRQALVVCQFAVLIGLMLATIVVYSQLRFAMHQGLKLDHDQVIAIETNCRGPFAAEVRRLPGVRAAACSEDLPIHQHSSGSGARANGRELSVLNVSVSPGFFQLYGLKPLAGVTAGGIAICIAWLTVSVHAFAVARARPVEALRYE